VSLKKMRTLQTSNAVQLIAMDYKNFHNNFHLYYFIEDY